MRQILAMTALLACFSAGVAFAGPDQVRPDQVKPSVAPIIKPDQVFARPDQVKHHVIKPDQVKVAAVKPDQVKVASVRPDQVKVPACGPVASTVKTVPVYHYHWHWHHHFVQPAHYSKG